MYCYCGKYYDFTGSPLISVSYDEKGKVIAWECIHGESWKENLPRVLQRYQINEFRK